MNRSRPVGKRCLTRGPLILAFVLAACAAAAPGSSYSAAAPARGGEGRVARDASFPRFSHVVILVMENKEYDRVIGNPDAPYTNRLAGRFGLATQSFAITHPSLPNYLALTGGSTFGITSDCTDCPVDSRNLIDQLERAHISWKAYMQGMPRRCFTGGSSGDYMKKHDPFVYYTDIAHDPSRCSKVVPFTRLWTDLKEDALPQFAWITPDMCNDMHDCDVATGDEFLSKLVPEILQSLGTSGVLFLTWDEGSTDQGCCGMAAGGHIVTIVAGPAVRRGVRSDAYYDHYSILRTIETVWGLPLLGNAGCRCTKAMTAFF